MSASDAQESAILRALFGPSSLTPPPIYYVRLSSTEPQEDGSGTTPPTDPGYAAVAVSRTDTNSWTHSSGLVQNGTIIQFAAAVSTPWEANYWHMNDAATGGTLHFKGSISPQQVVAVGNSLRFPVGGLTLSLT